MAALQFLFRECDAENARASGAPRRHDFVIQTNQVFNCCSTPKAFGVGPTAYTRRVRPVAAKNGRPTILHWPLPQEHKSGDLCGAQAFKPVFLRGLAVTATQVRCPNKSVF